MNKRINSIKSLKSLYTVVIGVALSLAAVELVGTSSQSLNNITVERVCLFLALISTLVPFYHGALRHLDDAYLEATNAHIKDGALILDVMLLLVHGLVFVVLAQILNTSSQFAWILVGLIGVDVVWGVFVHYGASSSGPGAEGKWAVINLIFMALGIFGLLSADVGFSSTPPQPLKVPILICIFSLVRTLVDYAFCWKFYFPPHDAQTSDPKGASTNL